MFFLFIFWYARKCCPCLAFLRIYSVASRPFSWWADWRWRVSATLYFSHFLVLMSYWLLNCLRGSCPDVCRRCGSLGVDSWVHLMRSAAVYYHSWTWRLYQPSSHLWLTSHTCSCLHVFCHTEATVLLHLFPSTRCYSTQGCSWQGSIFFYRTVSMN